MLCDLAVAAGLEEKRSNMANGVHINATEDRAGLEKLYDIINNSF